MRKIPYVLSGVIVVIAGVLLALGGRAKDSPAEADAKEEDNMAKIEIPENAEKATFAAGCFWGVEETFRNIDGVVSTSVGYTGGHTEEPSYREVCSDATGHAEAVQVIYDPDKVKYEDLLKVFWDNHDPTQLNRQGPDHGSQYRSAIFYHTPEQKMIAEKSKADLEASKKYNKPIVTEITPASSYYMAEDYHQQYLAKRGLGSCKAN